MAMTNVTDLHSQDDNIFDDSGPLTSSVAWACTVYSMVPYLGILFVPFAMVFGGIDYVSRRHGLGNRRAPLLPVTLSVFLLAIQLLLWWLLYLIPEIGI